VEFERTTLPELQKSAGVGETFHAGDAGDSTYWICYSVSSANQPYRIWFASGEMGGHEQAILSFYAEFSTYSVSPRSCPELPEHLRPVSLANNPLWLGADANQLKQRFGSASPRMVKGTWRFYAYEEKTRIKDEDFDRLATFGAQVRNNKVISLYEDQVTSD
jgi:hypothetical protein